MTAPISNALPVDTTAVASAADDDVAAATTVATVMKSSNDNETPPVYPMPVYLNFAPGGITFAAQTDTTTTEPATATATTNEATTATTIVQNTYNLTACSQSLNGASSSSGTSTPRSRRTSSGSLSSAVAAAALLSGTGSNDFDDNNDNNLASAASGGAVVETPDSIIYKAKVADDRLCSYIKLFVGAATAGPSSSASSGGGGGAEPPTPPTYLPSLSILANAAFGRLTGVPPNTAKAWADAMILQYADDDNDTTQGGTTWPSSEEDVLKEKPTPIRSTTAKGETTVALLKRLLEQGQAAEAMEAGNPHTCKKVFRPRPCGYVFKRGDIAWNCRTCQTDSTCVICDNCFRNSNHDGHEVYFHRTTPGGCCDCGDAEAWKVEGCCDSHRPQVDGDSEGGTPAIEDPEEAVRMAVRGLEDGVEALENLPTKLPPKLTAALGVVIGAAVRCLVQAVDGAGIGADPVQWKLRWADEAACIWNAAVQQEDYFRIHNSRKDESTSQSWKTPNDFLPESQMHRTNLPKNFVLQLRLHNDDVHTFDEVIDALHEPRHSRRNQNSDDPQSQSLVTLREAANEMTHHVDADGQVTVKTYSSIPSAMQGFKRLKSRGLHCAVVSTAQLDMELRARALSSWLAEISAAHPAAAVLVVHALLQVQSTQDLAGVAVWQEARSIPPWVAAGEADEVQASPAATHGGMLLASSQTATPAKIFSGLDLQKT